MQGIVHFQKCKYISSPQPHFHWMREKLSCVSRMDSCCILHVYKHTEAAVKKAKRKKMQAKVRCSIIMCQAMLRN